jgi:hypothetical protein
MTVDVVANRIPGLRSTCCRRADIGASFTDPEVATRRAFGATVE